MVQIQRPTPARAAAVPRDATVAAVWHDLNRIGLRVGMLAGFGAGSAYGVLFVVTQEPRFALSGVIGLVIGLAGLLGIMRPGRTSNSC